MPKTTNLSLEKAIEELLEGAPKIRNYSLEELRKESKKFGKIPWGGRCHREYIEAPRSSDEKIGSFYEKIRKRH